MAIQNRRGNKANFDPSKLLAGEFAFSLDTEELFYCVSPGNVKRCATKEEIQYILDSTPNAYDRLMELINALEDDPALSTSILTDIANLKNDKLDKTGDTKNNITTFTDATTRTNVISGEKHSVTFGKIKKYFTDMKALAFKDKVASDDLEATLKAYIDAKFDKANLANNLVSTNTELALAAPQGKVLKGLVDDLNNNLSFLDISSLVIKNDENVTSVNAYIESGMVVIRATIRSGVSGALDIFTIAENKYRPRVIINGHWGFPSSSNDTYSKVQMAQIDTAGGAKIWLKEAFTSTEILCFVYPARTT